jgi:hypothetical protein
MLVANRVSLLIAKWVTYHNTARPQNQDEGDGNQIWRIAAITNRESSVCHWVRAG